MCGCNIRFLFLPHPPPTAGGRKRAISAEKSGLAKEEDGREGDCLEEEKVEEEWGAPSPSSSFLHSHIFPQLFCWQEEERSGLTEGKGRSQEKKETIFEFPHSLWLRSGEREGTNWG